MSNQKAASQLLKNPRCTYGILLSALLFLTAALTVPTISSDASAPAQTEYCQQKYGTELRSFNLSDYRDALKFDPRCPTWKPLAIGVTAFGSTSDLEQMLMAGLPPNTIASSSWERQMTLLDAAIRGNKIGNVKLLLAAGASVETGIPILSVFVTPARAESNQTHAQRLELLNTLLAAGADPNLPCQRGGRDRVALHVATVQADIASVGVLLAAGANPDRVWCPDVPDYNSIMLPLFFKPYLNNFDSLSDLQRDFLMKRGTGLSTYTDWWSSPASPLEIAIAGDWIASKKSTLEELQMWDFDESGRRAQFRRIAVLLVNRGARAIGLSSDLELLMRDDPKLVSIGIAAARKAGYEIELIASLQDNIEKTLKSHLRTKAYLAMLKTCTNKVLEAKDDHFRLCASEE